MKHNIIRIIIIVVLLAVAVVLGIIAFKPVAEPNLVPIEPVSTPELVDIEIIPTPSHEPPTPTIEPTPEPVIEEASDHIEESSPKKENKTDANTAFILNINGERVKVAYGVEESTLKKLPVGLRSQPHREKKVFVLYTVTETATICEHYKE